MDLYPFFQLRLLFTLRKIIAMVYAIAIVHTIAGVKEPHARLYAYAYNLNYRYHTVRYMVEIKIHPRNHTKNLTAAAGTAEQVSTTF